MPGQLVILCSLQRIPVIDDTSGPVPMLGFGLNVTVGWKGDPATPSDRPMTPWVWPRLKSVKFYWTKSGSKLTSGNVAFMAQNGVPAETPPKFADELKRNYDQCKADVQNLKLAGPDALICKLDKERNLRPWHALLKHVSTYPFPFPQSSNISHLFRVPKDNEGDHLIAAPVIEGTGHKDQFPEVRYEPQADAQPVTNDVVEWHYGPTTPFQIIARLQPVPVSIDSTESFINLKNLWIEPPSNAIDKHFTVDWQANLEQRMSEGFNLPRFILEFMRDQDSDVQKALVEDDNARKCVALAVASLHDIVGLGCVAAPDGIRFAKRLFQLLLNTSDIKLLDKLDDPGANPTWEGLERLIFINLSEWMSFLASEVPKADALDILNGLEKRSSLSAMVSELEWLVETVLDTRPDRQGLNGSKDQRILWHIFIDQWKKLISVAPLDANLKHKMEDALVSMGDSKFQEGINIRQQLLLSNLGRFWVSLISAAGVGDPSDPSGHAIINKCFPQYLRYYASKRLGLQFSELAEAGCKFPNTDPFFSPIIPAGDFLTTDPAQPGNIGVLLAKKFNEWVNGFGTSLSPASNTGSETPHAITVQVARLQTDPGAKDPLEHMSGIGVLMRESNTQKWFPLTLASPKTQVDRKELIPGFAAHVPFRLHYRSGLRQVTISYKNNPISAESPLSDERMTSASLADPTGQPDALIRYDFFPDATMPGLRFGNKYDFAAFVVLNSGVLPNELSQAGSPCMLSNSFGEIPASAIISNIPYNRGVRIGKLRTYNCIVEKKNAGQYICSAPLETSKRYEGLNLPSIPDGVSVRARDLEVFGSEESDSSLKPPVILLAPEEWTAPNTPKRNIFAFFVRLPNVGWECWDIWVNKDVTKDERQKVLADYGRRTAKNSAIPLKTKAGAGGETEVLTDDAALEPQLFFILMKEENGGLSIIPTNGWKSLPISAVPSGSGILKYQGLPVPVICEYRQENEAEGLEVLEPLGGEPSKKLLVKVRDGELYRLTVCAAVSPASWNRFESNLAVEFPTPAGVNTGGLKLVSPIHFAVEAATRKLPLETKVYESTTTNFFSDGTSWKLKVSAGASDIDFRHLHRAEVHRQAWRWQGRPTAEHPDLAELDPKSTDTRRISLAEWEAVEFGERDDSDHVSFDMQSEKNAHDGTRRFSFEEIIGKLGDKSSKNLDLRGLHFRYGVRLFSRYEGLFPPSVPASVLGNQAIPGGKDEPMVMTPWHSQFAPCRRVADLDRPKILFVLPLTESFSGDKAENPGILVVLDEHWHELGGIGEELEAQVELASDPSQPQQNVTRKFFEFGPDPLITREGVLGGISVDDQAALGRVRFGKLLGPVGHFYDQDNDNALFVGSSFILPAPTIEPKQNVDWYFAKVSFRRIVKTRTPDYSVASLGSYSPGPLWKRSTLASLFTEPIWVQFLPAFSIFDGFDQTVDSLKLKFDQDFQLLDAQGKPVVLQPTASENHSFSLYIVLTARVFDVTGRVDQEVYIGLFKQGVGAAWEQEHGEKLKTWREKANPDVNFIARVIEIQEQKPDAVATPQCAVDPTAHLWEKLFGDPNKGDQNCDTTARIVRISRPIESNPNGSACGQNGG